MASSDKHTRPSGRLRIERTVDGSPVAGVDTSALPSGSMRRIENHSRLHLRADRYLWGIYIMLLIFSLVELYSASSSEVSADDIYKPLIQHAIFLFLGFGLVLVMQNIHYKYYRKLAWGFCALSLGLVIYSNMYGEVLNGAIRSIRVAGISIQPPEIAKLAMVLILARVMSKYQMRHGVTDRGIIISMIILAVYSLLLYSNGFTNTLMLVCIAIAMLIIAGTQARKLGILAVIFAGVGLMIYETKFSDKPEADSGGTATEIVESDNERSTDRTDLRKGRIASFLEGVHPQDSLTDYNRQVIFAKMSQAHGGLFGNGPGNSRESARLPLAYSDYIFSIIVEDIGFAGGVALLVLYMLLLARAGAIAWKCNKAFPALLITGCATLIALQALVHMAIVVGLFPVSGQPLPLISKGGSSILVMSAAIGMMLSVSKYAVQNSKKQTDTDIALRLAVEDSDDTSINPSQLTYENIAQNTYSSLPDSDKPRRARQTNYR